jgi:hypothetical protein
VWGFFGSLGLGVVAYAFKPDTSYVLSYLCVFDSPSPSGGRGRGDHRGCWMSGMIETGFRVSGCVGELGYRIRLTCLIGYKRGLWKRREGG